MIITLIAIGMFILGVILAKIPFISWMGEWQTNLEIVFKFFGALVGSIAILFIIFSHVLVKHEIELDNLQYESLIKSVEIVESEYEDVSKIELIKEVYEWNRWVKLMQLFGKSPWTNWFYSQKVIDNLKLIDF